LEKAKSTLAVGEFAEMFPVTLETMQDEENKEHQELEKNEVVLDFVR
jgi:hypothetical protein